MVPQPTSTQRVRLLSWVELEDEDGKAQVYRLVGADETDAKSRWISWKSPVGRGLLGKAVDDEVAVNTPGGTAEYVVLGIYNVPPAT